MQPLDLGSCAQLKHSSYYHPQIPSIFSVALRAEEESRLPNVSTHGLTYKLHIPDKSPLQMVSRAESHSCPSLA